MSSLVLVDLSITGAVNIMTDGQLVFSTFHPKFVVQQEWKMFVICG